MFGYDLDFLFKIMLDAITQNTWILLLTFHDFSIILTCFWLIFGIIVTFFDLFEHCSTFLTFFVLQNKETLFLKSI